MQKSEGRINIGRMHKIQKVLFCTIFTNLFKSKTFLLQDRQKNDRIITGNMQLFTPCIRYLLYREFSCRSWCGLAGKDVEICLKPETILFMETQEFAR